MASNEDLEDKLLRYLMAFLMVILAGAVSIFVITICWGILVAGVKFWIAAAALVFAVIKLANNRRFKKWWSMDD